MFCRRVACVLIWASACIAISAGQPEYSDPPSDASRVLLADCLQHDHCRGHGDVNATCQVVTCMCTSGYTGSHCHTAASRDPAERFPMDFVVTFVDGLCSALSPTDTRLLNAMWERSFGSALRRKPQLLCPWSVEMVAFTNVSSDVAEARLQVLAREAEALTQGDVPAVHGSPVTVLSLEAVPMCKVENAARTVLLPSGKCFAVCRPGFRLAFSESDYVCAAVPPPESEKLSDVGKAGIVIGTAMFLAIAVGLVMYLFKRNPPQTTEAPGVNQNEPINENSVNPF